MGYRSEVAYTIRFIPNPTKPEEHEEQMAKCRESFYTFIAEAKMRDDINYALHEDQAIDQHGEGFDLDEEKMQIRFYAKDVKWYSDYTDVKCHENLLLLAKEWIGEGSEEDNPYIGIAYARVGESTDDNEEYCEGTADWSWIGVSRQVYTDWL